MAVAVRTLDLRKTYTSSPPLGAAGGFIARADARGSKQGKVQIAALDGLSLDVQPGEIFGLLGPNGAGKSTTIGVLTARVRPTSGQAWIGGAGPDMAAMYHHERGCPTLRAFRSVAFLRSASRDFPDLQLRLMRLVH
jgi:ABC-type multidrug transport system ATPase subunit